MTTRRIGLLAALFTVVLALPAAAEELVVGTFGGTFVDNSKKCHAAAFEKATGATVKYVLGSSVQTMAKLRAAGARSELDVAYMDSQIVKQAKAEGLLQPLEPAKIAHWNDIYDVSRDKDAHWVSMMFAGTMITYNTKLVKEPPTSWADLWKPELKGRVEVLSEMRDTIGLIMLEQGVDISKNFTSAQYETAVDELQKHIADGQIRQVKGNSYKEDLISGDALAVIGWSGDIFQINAENGDKWGLTLPEAGGTLWSDNMLVPVGSPHKTNAEKLMNYYYDPKVAATVEAYVNYICPVQGAKEEMEKIDPDLAASPWIFPDDATLAKAKVFRTLTPDEETQYSESFQKVIGN